MYNLIHIIFTFQLLVAIFTQGDRLFSKFYLASGFRNSSMVEEILKAVPVFLASMIKFIFGPLSGYAAGLKLVTTILSTIGGMMTVVFAFTYFGTWLRNNLLNRFFSHKKLFSSRSRKFVVVWKKYGLLGVAALTPLILTPIGGTILAVSSGSPKEKIILYMFISACFWGISLTLATYFFGHAIWPDFIK